MPPTGGQGASTAIVAAGRLARRLSAAAAGQVGLVTAVADFARHSRVGPAALAESLQPVRWVFALDRPRAVSAGAVGSGRGAAGGDYGQGSA